MQKVRSAWDVAANLVVPNTCLVCDTFVARNGGCCASCWSKLKFIHAPLCPVMGSPFSVDMGTHFLSAEAIANPPPFERLRAVMLYDDLARMIVSSIKYRDRGDLSPWIANWMNTVGKELIADADLIVPVPLHKSRLRTRWFNQSAELARQVARANYSPYRPEVMIRRKSTRQQVGLSQSQRERNVSGAFVVPDHQRIHLKGKRILLIDDVYTTGATAKAATRALLRGGAAKIDVLVFAKVETNPN